MTGRLRLVWAAKRYHNHKLYGWVAANARDKVEVVRRPECTKGFVILPRRWVERAFAWLKRLTRLTADREMSTFMGYGHA